MIDNTEEGESYTQDYLGSIEYKNEQLEAIYHEEGKISITPEGYQNEYYLKDHLGNIRVVFADKNQDGEIDPTNELLQENHFYPFGLQMDGFSQNYATTSATNRYTYNGKELNGDLGLDMHDYGARWYDASIARWNSVDPLAEKYYSISSYVYVANNPLKFIDPDGRLFIIGNGEKVTKEDKRLFKMLNSLSDNIFEMDKKTGIVSLKEGKSSADVQNSNETSQKLAKLIEEGASPGSQTVHFTAVSQKEGMLVDDMRTGEVDIDDLEGLDNPVVQAAMAGHFIAERYALPDYERRKGAIKSHEDPRFAEPHGQGNIAEAKIVEGMTGSQTDGARKGGMLNQGPSGKDARLFQHSYGKGVKVQYDVHSNGTVSKGRVILPKKR